MLPTSTELKCTSGEDERVTKTQTGAMSLDYVQKIVFFFTLTWKYFVTSTCFYISMHHDENKIHLD